MAETSPYIITIMEPLMDWEIQVLILLSFALQVFLFFSGGLRRRHGHMLLRVTLWLSYLAADFIAIYALGYLSRNLPTTDGNGHHKLAYQLTLLWAPFLLIHLGGQDTVTAFSLEDNELWLRHLLNLLSQACLVLYVLWKLVALAQYQLVIPAALLFVAGIIKYGERIWALKLGSQKGLRTSTIKELEDSENNVQDYQAIVKSAALNTERGLWLIFGGWILSDMQLATRRNFRYRSLYDVEDLEETDVGVDFKRAEIELSIMYYGLFTKSRVIQTRAGTILRCASLASTAVAFVLYVKMMMSRGSGEVEQTADKEYRRRVDAAITYTLFIGAFFLEACSFFIMMVSPWQWPLLEGGAGSGWIPRVAWPIFVRIQPESKPWWSNSMGQYNLVRSSISTEDHRKWSCSTIVAMAKKMAASDMWNKISNTKHAQVTMDIMHLIHLSIPRDGPQLGVPGAYYRDFLAIPFEEVLLTLHLWTCSVLYKAETKMKSGAQEQDQEAVPRRRHLMDTCKNLSEYMLYLMVEHPAMLPVGTNLQVVMAVYSSWIRKASSEDDFLGRSFIHQYPGVYHYGPEIFLLEQSWVLEEEEGGIDAELERLGKVWARMLVYAAGKCRAEEHARRLCTGGELITLVWLLMLHHGMGDAGEERVSLMEDATGDVHLFDLELEDSANEDSDDLE